MSHCQIYHKKTILPQKSCRMPRFRSIRFNTLQTRRFCCIYPEWQFVTDYLAPQTLHLLINPGSLIPAPIHPPRQSNHGSRRAKTQRKTKGTWIAHTGPSVYCTILSLTATFVPPQVNSNQLSRSARHAIGRFVISRRGQGRGRIVGRLICRFGRAVRRQAVRWRPVRRRAVRRRAVLRWPRVKRPQRDGCGRNGRGRARDDC